MDLNDERTGDTEGNAQSAFGPPSSRTAEKEEQLGAYAMKRVAAGARMARPSPLDCKKE